MRHPAKGTKKDKEGGGVFLRETILLFSSFSFFVLCCFVSEDARWVGFGGGNTIGPPGSFKTNAGARALLKKK